LEAAMNPQKKNTVTKVDSAWLYLLFSVIIL